MKKQVIVYLLCSLLPIICFAQRKKRSRGKTITVSTSINYYPSLKPYDFFSEIELNGDDLILTFLTPNSGTFVIEDGATIPIERELTTRIPSQLFGVGASVQFDKEKSLFHEISLTKLSIVKSSYNLDYIFKDSLGDEVILRRGYDQRSMAFAVRYEVGKFFGDPKWAALRFGLSGGIETSFYFYKRIPTSSIDYPVRANITTLEVALIPMLTAKLSKKVSLDFKLIPNMLLGDFGSIKEENPTLPTVEQVGEREYKSPDFNVGFSLMLRYKIKEPRKRRR